MKKKILLLLIISMILNTGCWDMIEIEDRLLPFAIAIDTHRKNDNEEDPKKFFICFFYPNINALGKSPTQEGLSHMVSANANSIFEAIDEISSRVYNSVFLKHLNHIIITEEVASDENNMREIIDGLKRDFIINKMINLIITRESAHELIEKKIDSTSQVTVEGYLTDLLRNQQKSTAFTPINLKQFVQNTDHQKVSIIPLASSEPDIQLSGGALFKDFKLLGFIDGDDNRNISILNNEAHEENLDFDYNGANLALSLIRVKSKQSLVKDSDLFKIKYDVSMDAEIHQYIMDPDKKIDSEEKLNNLEETTSKLIEKELMSSVERLQNEFNGDALGILEYLYKFHPKIYQEVEKDWNTIFPYMDIEIDVEVKVRRRGLTDF